MGEQVPVGRRTLLAGALGCTIPLAGCIGDVGNGDEEESGTIRVTALEEPEPETSGDPIEGATVTVNGYEEETDADGEAVIDGLEEDQYTIEVDADGYESYEDGVDFDFDLTTEYDTEVLLPPE